jgi:gliding motility-associated-like protein
MRILVVLFFLVISTLNVIAQQPRVANLSQSRGVTGRSIEIAGSGFSTNPADLRVWFGGSRGTILNSTENIIEVEVPPGVTTSSITVTNLATGLTGFSSQKFHLVFPGDPAATVTAPERYTFAVTKELFDVVIADLDGDGKNDVVVTEIDDTGTEIIIYHNDAVTNTISFTTSTINISKPTVAITTGDIDGDGKLDLVMSRGGNTRNQIYVLLNTSTVGNISFAAAKSYFLTTGHNAHRLLVRDMDLDGKSDVVVTNTSNNLISIFENNSVPGNINLNFTAVELPITNAPSTNGLAIDDFNGDGKPDIAVTTFLDSDIFIVPNNSVGGNLQFGSVIAISAGGNLNNIIAGDINEDGKIDLVVTKPIQNEIAVLTNQSTDAIAFSAPLVYASGSGSWGMSLVDYVGNGRLDIMVTSPSGASFTFFKNTSSGGTLSLTKRDVAQTNRTRNVFSGDLSNDGKPDLAMTANDAAGTSYLLLAVRNSICVAPLIRGDTNVSICNGQTYTFVAAPNPDTNYVWKKDGVEVKNSADAFYTTSEAGSFTLTTESEGGACSIESAPVTVTLTSGTIPNDPVASNNGPTCIDTDVTLSSTTVTGATYEWTGPNGFTSSLQNPVISNVTPDQAGFYYVKAIISPCESAVSQTLVEVITPPDFTIVTTGSTNFCVGGFVTLSVSSVTGYDYQWTVNGTDIGGANSSSYSATTAGDYQCHITGSTTNCDLLSDIVTVTTFPAPAPAFTVTGNTCVLETITFEDNSVLETDQTATYTWDFDDGTAMSTVQNPTHSYATIGTYNVSLTVGYQGETCTETIVQAVTIADPTPFTIAVTGTIPFCEGDSVLLEVPGTYSSYLWNNGATTANIYAKAAGTFTATATNSNGCPFTDQVDLTTIAAPTINVTADKTSILPGGSSQLEATGANTYTWTPAESLSDANIANPVATPTVTTTYVVRGDNDAGCFGTGEITITVEDTGETLPVTAPKMFSPNGDGTDDFWVIENMLSFPDCKVTVFTRGGKTVFEAVPYNNNWDGITLDGTKLAEGAYYYIITCDDGKAKSGSVSIIE